MSTCASTVSRARNTSAITPIGRLLPELLLDIFHHFQLSGDEAITWLQRGIEDTSEPLGGRVFRLTVFGCPTLISTLMVCRHWRAVALGSSSLWSYIPVDANECLWDFMINYSRNYPLTLLRAIVLHSRKEGPYIRIMNILRRVRSMDVKLSNRDPGARATLSNLLDARCAPQMECLSVSIDFSTDGPQNRNIKMSSPLPPLLTSLSLSGIHPSNPPHASHMHLTSLKINDLPLPSQCHKSDGFLDVLTRFPNLQTIELEASQQGIPRTRPSPRVARVSLPHLSHFKFSGTPAHFAYLYPSLLVSATATYRVVLYDRGIYDREYEVPHAQGGPPSSRVGHTVRKEYMKVVFTELEQLFSRRFSSIAGENLGVDCVWDYASDEDEDLKINLTTIPGLCQTSDLDTSIGLTRHDATSARLIFSLSWVHDEDWYQFEGEREWDHRQELYVTCRLFPFLSKFFGALPPDAAHHLHLRMAIPYIPHVDNAPWQPPFLDWAKLHTLHLEGAGLAAWMASHLAHTTRPTQGMRRRETTAMPLYPSLKVLILDKINKSSYVNDYGLEVHFSGEKHRNTASIINQWHRVLCSRAKSGYHCRLERLGLIEGGGRRLWRTWLNVVQDAEVEWLEGCELRWRRDTRRDYPSSEEFDYESEDEDRAEEGWIMRVYDDKTFDNSRLGWYEDL